jgi:hypothetical protein
MMTLYRGHLGSPQINGLQRSYLPANVNVSDVNVSDGTLTAFGASQVNTPHPCACLGGSAAPVGISQHGDRTQICFPPNRQTTVT